MDLAFNGQKKKKIGPCKNWTHQQLENELNKFEQTISYTKECQGEIEVRDTILNQIMTFWVFYFAFH